jgi:hypothetical protein
MARNMIYVYEVVINVTFSNVFLEVIKIKPLNGSTRFVSGSLRVLFVCAGLIPC